MTEPAQVRLKLDPELHTEFKAQCARTGVSMADQTARMIAQFLDTNRIPDEQPKSVAVDADHNPESCARLPPPVEHSVEQVLADHRDILLGVMDQLATGKNINWLLAHIDEAADRRQGRTESSVTNLGDKVTEAVEASHRRWQQIAAKNRRDRYWLGGAALAGMAALGLMLVLVSGTGIGRSLAVSLTGAKTRWDAALSLAGDGNQLHARMMSETRALLNDPLFKEPYVNCVERAKRAKAPFSCKLKMTPLRPAP